MLNSVDKVRSDQDVRMPFREQTVSLSYPTNQGGSQVYISFIVSIKQ